MTSASSSFLRRDRRVVAEARRGRALESMDDSDSSSLLGQPFSGGSADMIDKRQKEKRNEEPKNYSLTMAMKMMKVMVMMSFACIKKKVWGLIFGDVDIWWFVASELA